MVIYLGSLVQLCCGKGGTLQANITGVCGKCSQYLDHTGFASTQGMCAFPDYTAQAPGCSARWALGCVHFPGLSHSGSVSWVLHKSTDLVGPVFCALPRSEQLRRPGAWQAHTPQVGRCVLSPSPFQPPGFLGAQQERHLRCATCLLWAADLWLRPSWWMSTIQDSRKTRLATRSLLAVW